MITTTLNDGHGMKASIPVSLTTELHPEGDGSKSDPE